MLKCEQGVPAGGLAARRPEEHGLQRDLEKSLGKKTPLPKVLHNITWEQSRGRSGRLRATWTIRNRQGKQKRRDLTHCQGCSWETV